MEQEIKLGLTRMRDLMSELNYDYSKVKFIHIAGTNGKGSVATFISSVLAKAGYKVGRYVSPTVFCKEEMIQIESKAVKENISKSDFDFCEREVDNAIKTLNKKGYEMPTVFEKETAMAFLAFIHKQVDFAIVEAGMGGISDATNIIPNPVMSIITPIAYDHMNYLGQSIAEITKNKAGIIKKDSIVVTMQTDDECIDIIKRAAKNNNSEFVLTEKSAIINHGLKDGYRELSYKQNRYEISNIAKYQLDNAALALECIYSLRELYNISEDEIKEGMKSASWLGRFSVIGTKPTVIIDGAHNEAGAIALHDALEEHFLQKKIIGIMGVFADKEYEKIVDILSEVLSEVIVVDAPTKRGLDRSRLRECFCGKVENIYEKTSAKEALSMAKEIADIDDVIVIFGTLSILKDVIEEVDYANR